MTRNEDLNKLFEAALQGRKAPSRFGTPEEQRKFSPIPVQPDETAAVQESRFQAVPAPVSGELEPSPAPALPPAPAPNSDREIKYKSVAAPVPSAYQRPTAPPSKPAFNSGSQSPFSKPVEATPIPQVAQPRPQPVAKVAQPSSQFAFRAASSPAQAEPIGELVTLDERNQASLDAGLSEELGSIIDAKVVRAKRQRRLIFTLIFFVALIGGATAWVVTNPERFEAMKKVAAEIKSVGDIKGIVENYKEALDKAAVHGEQINAATGSMGVDPASVDEGADQGFDKEMQEMTGGEGVPRAASGNATLQENFKDVQENGMPIKGSDETKEGETE